MIESVEGIVPGTAMVMRRGARIVKDEIEAIKNQIYIQAEEICLLVKNESSPYKDFGREIHKLGKRLREGKHDQKVIQEEFPRLKLRIPEILPEINPSLLEYPFAVIQNPGSPKNQFIKINTLFVDIHNELQNELAGISRSKEIASALTKIQGQLGEIHADVRNIDTEINELQKNIPSLVQQIKVVTREIIENSDIATELLSPDR